MRNNGSGSKDLFVARKQLSPSPERNKKVYLLSDTNLTRKVKQLDRKLSAVELQHTMRRRKEESEWCGNWKSFGLETLAQGSERIVLFQSLLADGCANHRWTILSRSCREYKYCSGTNR